MGIVAAIRNFFDPVDTRLQAELARFELELTLLPDDTVRKEARNWLDAAQHEARLEHGYAAWDRLHSLERCLFASLSPTALADRITLLKHEVARKIDKSSWRGEAAAKLIEKLDDAAPNIEKARTLHRLLAEHQQNQHYKRELLSTLWMPGVGWGMFALVSVVFVLSLTALCGGLTTLFDSNDYNATKSMRLARLLLVGMSAGVIGGLLSAALSLNLGSLNAPTPELRASRWFAGLKPLIGAVVAIPVTVLVSTGTVAMLGLSDGWLVFAAGFIAGFSDRWFLKLVEKVEGGK